MHILSSLAIASCLIFTALCSPSVAAPQQMEFLPSSSTSLDPATAEFLERFSKMFGSIAHLPIAEQRATIKKTFSMEKSSLESIAKVEDKVLAGRNGPISIRLFTPRNEGPLPVLVYYHGGGWVYGSVEGSEAICRKLANTTGAIVAAVEYRLSPEHKFPVPLHDCYDATKWIAKNASAFSGDPNKLIISGDSAGGNLAAAVALIAREEKTFSIAGQLLIYPVLTTDLVQKYYDESPDKSIISLNNMQFFINAYLSSPEDSKNPYAAPLESKNLAQLPSCFILTAEYDALKHEGERYSKALQQAGIKVQHKCYPGVIHGFLMFPLADGVREEALEDIKTWVKGL